MKFSVNQSDLRAALQIVERIASTRTVLDTQNAVLFSVADNKLTLKAFDGSNVIETSIVAEVEQQGEAVVLFNYVSELIKKMPESIINFELEDNIIKIKVNRSRYKVNCLMNKEEYKMPEISDAMGSLELDAADFSKSIGQVKFAIGRNSDKDFVTNVLFDFKEEELTLVALDGYRMAVKTIPVGSVFETKAIVTDKTILEVQRLLNLGANKLNITVGSSKIKFDFGDTLLISNLVSVKYIDYLPVLNREFKSFVEVNKEEFNQAVERTTVISGSNKICIFDINDDGMVITATSDGGDAREEVEIELEGQDIKIGFNPDFILDVLRVLDEEKVKICFTDRADVCVLEPVGSSNYRYLMMPTVF